MLTSLSAVNLVTSPVTAPTQLLRELLVVDSVDKAVVVVTRSVTRSVQSLKLMSTRLTLDM